MKFIAVLALCLVASVSCNTIQRIEANQNRMEAAGQELVKAVTEVMRMEENSDNSVINALQDALNNILERINNRVNKHKENAAELLEKAKELAKRLKDLHADVSGKAKDLITRWASGLSSLLRKFAEKMIESARDKRSIFESDEELLAQVANLRKIYEELLKKIESRVNSASTPEELKEQLKLVKSQLDQALSEYLERILMPMKDFNITKRSAEEGENIIDEIVSEESDSLLKKIMDHLSGRYTEFVNFIKELYNNVLSKIQNRHEKLVAVAKEIIAESRQLHKETLREAMEILEPYKEELGGIWNELVDAVNKALAKRND